MLEETNFFSAFLESAITNCSSCTKLCNLKGKEEDAIPLMIREEKRMESH